MDDFSKKFITDDGEYCYVANDVEGTTTPKWIEQSHRTLLEALLKEVEGSLPNDDEVRKWQEELSPDFTDEAKEMFASGAIRMRVKTKILLASLIREALQQAI